MAQEQFRYYVFYEVFPTTVSQTEEAIYFSGIISFQSTFTQQSRRYEQYGEEFARQLEAKLGVTSYFPDYGLNYFHASSKQWAEEELSNARARCEGIRWACIFTNWVPGTELRISGLPRDGKATSSGDSTVTDRLFSPQARYATKTWMERSGIAPGGDAEKTLALMVQTALALLDFDPGPKDGKIGPKTLAAIAASQAVVGFLAGADLGDVLSAILHTAMRRQALDPGPVDRMFGQNALNTVAAWQSAHGPALAEAQRARPDYGEESGDLLLIPGWIAIPGANSCVSIDPSKNGKMQFIVNNCNHKVHVQWCYAYKPGWHFAQCIPGPPGRGYMDAVEHSVVVGRGAGTQDYYWGGQYLEPKSGDDRVYGQDHSPMLELGRIKYIACGYDHINGATRYKMQWDANTGDFRCLAYFPPNESEVPSEATVQ